MAGWGMERGYPFSWFSGIAVVFVGVVGRVGFIRQSEEDMDAASTETR